MQTNRNDRFRPASAPQSVYINPRFLPEDNLRPVLLLGILCLLLPPVGLVMLWRARRLTINIRAIFSGIAFASMTLIFFLLMQPAEIPSDIRPMPATPAITGYGSASQNPSFFEEGSIAPAQPDAVPAPVGGTPAQPTIAQVSDQLTNESIVFAVTNNASSYHLYEICDFQENRRALTLSQALSEGLTPCEKCVGPVE